MGAPGPGFTGTGQCKHHRRRASLDVFVSVARDWKSSVMADVAVTDCLSVRLSMAADQPGGGSADPEGDYPRR